MVEVKRKVNGKANRIKGHNYERYLANKFREIGYLYCKTSRATNRMYDDCGIDLTFLPFNVQAKKVKATINYTDIFENIEVNLKKNYPPGSPEISLPSMIFHSRGRKDSESYVIIKEKDMFEILRKLQTIQ